MQGTGRLTMLAVAVFLLLLAGYAWVGYGLQQQYQAETALQESLGKTAPVYLALRRQPADDLESMSRQVAEWQQKVTAQQALFPKESEVNSALSSFLALAGKNGIFITRVDALARVGAEDQGGGISGSALYGQGEGELVPDVALSAPLAEQTDFVPMGFDNLVVSTDPLGDDLSFDLLIYVRTA